MVTAEADRNLAPRNREIQREFVFLVVALIPQHQDPEGLEREAPDHAERVRLAEQVDVAAAGDDCGDLEQRHRVQDAVRRAVLVVGLAEPVDQHAVFGDAIQHAVDADQRGVDRARENQDADDHDEDVEARA